MKIATRIAAGYLVLIGLMVAVLAYELSLVHRLQSMNRDLAEQINTRAIIFSLQAGDLAQIEEFTRKFFLTGDPAYNDQLQALWQLFVRDFEKIRAMNLSETERQEIGRLSRLWDEFSQLASRHGEMLQTASGPLNARVLARELDYIGRLRAQTDRVIEANAGAIKAKAEQSTVAGQRAEWISQLAAVAALGVGILASVLIIGSISKPLAQLTEGTRAVAEGKFSYRLSESGNHEFAWLAGQFNRMTARLNELDEMKKDFVSHVSHELKTPLASVQETIRLLLEEIPGPLTEKQRRLLQLGLTSSSRLFSMIQDLLDVSRIEAGAMEYDFRSHDLVGVARAALEEFQVVVEGNNRIEVCLPEQPVMVEGDRERLIQIVRNLLGNALKFSGGHSPVQLRLETTREVTGRMPRRPSRGPSPREFALISVSDRGPGIPDTHKERIFEKFQQVKQGTGLSGEGAGLGLAICRAVVQAHHGAIWVENRAGGGSVFCVLLPTAAV